MLFKLLPDGKSGVGLATLFILRRVGILSIVSSFRVAGNGKMFSKVGDF
jgi:hypothetical protein